MDSYEDLLTYLPVFNNPEFKPYTLVKNDYRTFIQYHLAVKTFCESASQDCWYSEYDPFIADEMLKSEQLLSNASLDEIKAMLTYFVCGERFSDGFQAQLIIDGHIQRLLERLKKLKDL
jgi:Family of unknown function (DUF6508)